MIMRYHEILNEKITNRPYRLDHYVKRKIIELTAIENELIQARAMISAHRDGVSLLERCARHAGHDEVDLEWFGSLADEGMGGSFRLERYYPVRSLRQSLESYTKYGRDFLQYVMSSFQYTEELHPLALSTLTAIPDIPKGLEEYGYNPGEDYSDDEDYIASTSLLKGLNLLREAIIKAQTVGQDVKNKLGEVYKMSAMGRDWEKYRPDHEDVETLYHASAFCSEILRDGFQAEMPEGRRGLGNYGKQIGVSFTHSLDVAHTLSRVLKEVWMIAHGQLTARHILGWIKSEKIDQEYADLKTTVGIGEEIPGEKRFGPRYRVKELHELKTPEETVRLYRVYLALSKMRTDPVMTNPEETLKIMADRRIEDIGVLACEVRLTKEDEYMIGEAEFRLPADRVISIKRLF